MMKAAVLHAPGDLRVEQVPVPEDLGADEVLVRVMAAGICGSDIGRVGTTGTYSFPTIPGHEFAGVVEQCGSAVSTLSHGDKVAVAPLMPCFECSACAAGNYSLCEDYDFLGSRCDGGFAQYVKAPARNVLKVPETIDFEIAATIESAAIVLHGIQKIDLQLGDPVAVVGCGALGFFAVQLAKLSGAGKVIAVDIDDEKLNLASQVGADLCVNPVRQDAEAVIRAATKGQGVSLVLECAGNNPGRDLALSIAARQAKIVLYGSAHGNVTFDGALFERIVRREIEIIGSWNSYSVPFPGREWYNLMELLEDGRLLVKPLISHRCELEEAPEVFAKLKERSLGAYHKIIFTPNT